jgi:PncC family amidohydrolase
MRGMGIKYDNIEKIISQLMKLNYTISFMEACSGGCLANAFTNVSGVSHVLNFSAVTYSSEAKIKLGVNPKTIESNGIYSTAVSKEMAKAICSYSNCQIGVGVTGNLNLVTQDGSKGGEVYISIYNNQTKQYSSKVITIKCKNRELAKEAIINFISEDLMKILAI